MAKGGQIVAVETPIVDLPLKRVHRLSRADVSTQSYALCRIHTEDGIIGIGDGVVPGGPWWGGESAETIKTIIDTQIAPVLVGTSVFDLNVVRAEIDKRVFGNPVAKSAVEIAMLDAASRSLGIPLNQYLGGAQRSSIDCLWALAVGELEADVAEAEAMIADNRHKMFKIKVGFATPEDDIARVIATAERIGRPCSIDLNEAWNMAQASHLLPMLEGSGIVMIEQPISRTNLAGLATLSASSTIPIMADEAACSPADALSVIEQRAASALSLKISKSGGPSASLHIARMAQTAGLGVFGGTALDGSIGVAASLHAFSTLPELTWGCELFGPLLLAEDIVSEPLTYSENQVWLPESPGLGVTADEDRIRHFAREGTFPAA